MCKKALACHITCPLSHMAMPTGHVFIMNNNVGPRKFVAYNHCMLIIIMMMIAVWISVHTGSTLSERTVIETILVSCQWLRKNLLCHLCFLRILENGFINLSSCESKATAAPLCDSHFVSGLCHILQSSQNLLETSPALLTSLVICARPVPAGTAASRAKRKPGSSTSLPARS